MSDDQEPDDFDINDDNKDPNLFDINDVAKLLGRSVNQARRMRALGTLPPATRIGDRLYWRKSAMIELFNENKEPPSEDD
jgi:predicted DNA-binding transcriptional regulator AlpA